MSRLGVLGRALTAHLGRRMLARLGPEIDATPTEGGRGPSPLGSPPDVPWWREAPTGEPIGDAALLAGIDNDRCLEEVGTWIAAGRPGEGEAWESATLVSIRLIHLAAVHAWTTPAEPFARALAGSANAHLAWLAREAPLVDGEEAVLAWSARSIGGLTWPTLPGARDAWSQGLTALRTALPAMLEADGVPKAAFGPTARALWAAALARAWARANGAGFPAPGEDALLAGSQVLWRIGGDPGVLPVPRARPALLPLGPTPLPHTLRNLTLAWAFTHGSPAAEADPACENLAGSVPDGAPEAMATDRWQLWDWPDSGLCVGHALVVGRSGRGRADARDGSVSFDVDGQALAWSALGAGRRVVARTEGSRIRIIFDIGERGCKRDILFEGGRMTVVDQGVSELRWHVDRRWQLRPTEQGYCGSDPSGAALVVQVDPEWVWRIERGLGDTILIGHGDGGTVARVSVEYGRTPASPASG